MREWLGKKPSASFILNRMYLLSIMGFNKWCQAGILFTGMVFRPEREESVGAVTPRFLPAGSGERTFAFTCK
jgi:hypothetical protein